MSVFLLDTGPLVALLNAKDRYHRWARQLFNELTPPLLSCEAVFSEVCFLLKNSSGGSSAALALVTRQLITLPFRLDEESDAVRSLMTRYANVPMSLADACLVRLAEIHRKSVVVTLDRDFFIYRKSGRSLIPTVMPDDRKQR